MDRVHDLVRAVFTVVYAGRVRGHVHGPCIPPCTVRVHDRIHVRTVRVHGRVSHGRVHSSSTGCVHGRVLAVCTARIRPVHGPRVYAGRVHGLSNLSSLSNVHFTGWASYPSWVGVLPHSWGKTPTLSPLRSKRLARKSKVISNSYFVMCESGHGLFSLPTQLSFTVY